MAYTNIDDPSAYFQATTYTGGGANTEVTNSGNSDLKPDFLWIKNRTAGYGHFVVDSNRNISYAQNSSNAPYLETESTAAENNNQNWMASVNTNGFTTGISEHINNNSGSAFVAWQWKCQGGTTASNTDGSITSTVQANQDAGFSIVTYTGTGGGETFGHGLGVAPDMWIVKRRSGTGSWAVGFNDANILGGTSKYLILQSTAGTSTYNNFWGTSPASSTVMRIAGDATIGGSGSTYVAYCFAEKQGYSKFGKYVGNGNANGTFVYTGFKPAFVMIKDVSRATNWEMFDHKRNPSNVANLKLGANLAVAENGSDLGTTSQNNIDMLSNGFKMRTGNTDTNLNGDTFIYMAFAENSLVSSSGVPCTAK